MIPVLSLEPFALPTPAPITPLEVNITPSARGQPVVILLGSSINSSSVMYSDLHGLSAYAGAGGMQTVNRGRKGRRRTARGVEDGRQSAR
jgi:hypothetical protein